MNPRFAILLDGGFVTKALSVRLKAFPSPADIQAECQRIIGLPHFAAYDLIRIYFYDAPPATTNLTNPISGDVVDLGTTTVHAQHTSLLERIELMENFAVRRGETVVRGWKIGQKAFKSMTQSPRAPVARDLVPNAQQKGVDLRIGLDVARLSLKANCQAIVFVGGDSDMVPVFKFARREGVRVYLDHLGLPVRRELLAHADVTL